MAIGEPTLVLALNGRSRLEGFMHSAVARLGGDVGPGEKGSTYYGPAYDDSLRAAS